MAAHTLTSRYDADRHLVPESDDFLRLVDRGMCISHGIPSRGARLPSSAYPSPGHNTPRVQSPVSEFCPGHRLSFSGLSRFGRANDCLSNLRSSTPSSGHVIGDNSQDLMADTAAAVTEWQDTSRPMALAACNEDEAEDEAGSSDLFP